MFGCKCISGLKLYFRLAVSMITQSTRAYLTIYCQQQGRGWSLPSYKLVIYYLFVELCGWWLVHTVHLPKATTSYLPVPNVHVGIIQSITSIQNPEQYRANEELRPKRPVQVYIYKYRPCRACCKPHRPHLDKNARLYLVT